jgi:hypothetical protein
LCAEARGVFLKDNMDGSGDSAGFRVVNAVPGCVIGVADHDATKRLFTEFSTQFVRHLGEDGAPEDAKLGGVRHRRREEGKWDATGGAD